MESGLSFRETISRKLSCMELHGDTKEGMRRAELQKASDFPSNLDFKVRPSSFQSFVNIKKPQPFYIKKGIN